MIEDEASSDSDERRRHTRGPLYQRTNGTVYDESQILSENYFFFDRAHSVSFIVHDCIVYAVNAAFRHPIFVFREQVHRLARLRQKKDEDAIIDKKVEGGYSLALF